MQYQLAFSVKPPVAIVAPVSIYVLFGEHLLAMVLTSHVLLKFAQSGEHLVANGAWIVAALRFIVICITHGGKHQNFPSNFPQFYHYLWIYPTDRFSCLQSKPVRHDTDRWRMFSNPRYPTRLWIMMMMLFGFGLVMEVRRFHYRVIKKQWVCSFPRPKSPELDSGWLLNSAC